MHDRPSEKPLSMFTRASNKNQQPEGEMDTLMEEYSHVNSSSATHPTQMQTQLKGLTHHPNMSITSSATVQTTDTTQTKKSSIFRFGRSMASTFNPVHIWNSLSNSWSQAKEELEQEAKDPRQKEWDDRKAKAEAAYAELKKLGPDGFKKAVPQGLPGFTNSNRDSGIEMDDETPRPSTESKLFVPFPTASVSIGQSCRRPSFHFRTPSLSNLKKRASDINLHRRTTSLSKSPEKQDAVEPAPVHRTLPKKDLNRQAKLTKKVSDLEAKLEKAKKELQEVMDVAPPVPPIPEKHAQAPRSRSASRPRSAHVKKFEPLPTLPSERLLFTDTMRQSNVPDIAEQYFEAEAKTDVIEETIAGAEIEPTNTKYEFSIKELAKESSKSDDVNPKTPNNAIIEPTSFFYTSSPATSPAAKKTPAVKKISKRRKSDELSKSYKPGSSLSDDEAEWKEAAKPKKKKKTSPPDQPSPKDSSKESKHTSKKETDDAPPKFPSRRSSLAHPSVPSKPQPTRIPSPTNEPTSPRGHIRHRHQRSLSPEKPGRVQYRRRSPSPPPKPASKEVAKTRKALRKKGAVVAVRPNGRDVPPMPEVKKAKERKGVVEKEEYPWPDDVF